MNKLKNKVFFKSLCELSHNIRTEMFFISIGVLYNDSSQARVFGLLILATATSEHTARDIHGNTPSNIEFFALLVSDLSSALLTGINELIKLIFI